METTVGVVAPSPITALTVAIFPAPTFARTIASVPLSMMILPVPAVSLTSPPVISNPVTLGLFPPRSKTPPFTVTLPPETGVAAAASPPRSPARPNTSSPAFTVVPPVYVFATFRVTTPPPTVTAPPVTASFKTMPPPPPFVLKPVPVATPTLTPESNVTVELRAASIFEALKAEAPEPLSAEINTLPVPEILSWPMVTTAGASIAVPDASA